MNESTPKYDLNEIKQIGNCIRFYEEVLGGKVKGKRCSAIWRGSQDTNISITEDKFFDHVANKGGSIIDLCMASMFGDLDERSALNKAQNYLGEWLQLTPKQSGKTTNSKGEVVKVYQYCNAQGDITMLNLRYEPKIFGKRYAIIAGAAPKAYNDKTQWGFTKPKDFITPLYNEFDLTQEPTETLYLAEGEKDSDSLKSLGYLSSCSKSCGAIDWQSKAGLLNRDIVIVADNDNAGIDYANKVYKELISIAKSVKIVMPQKEGQDFTDWLEEQKGQGNDQAQIKASFEAWQPIEPTTKRVITNFIESEEQTPTGRRSERHPKQLNKIIDETKSYLDYKLYRIGDIVFGLDHKEPIYLYNADDLFTHLSLKTGSNPLWASGVGYASKNNLYCGIRDVSKKYNAISTIPDYPTKDDTLYLHDTLPKADTDHKYFWGFVDLFTPKDQINRKILASLVIAPLFNPPKIDKPLFIIDSVAGQGSGKSTVPEMIATLYDSSENGGVCTTTLTEINNSFTELTKRLLSTSGRNARVLLVDNVTQILKSANFAQLITANTINGRPSYGRAEESRPNNLTYVVTVNGATVDSDMASRAFYLTLAKPNYQADWKPKVLNYIDKNRYNIFADIIDIISTHKPLDLPIRTRTPQFETEVLHSLCESKEELNNILDTIMDLKAGTNTDKQEAEEFMEEIEDKLSELPQAFGKPKFDLENDIFHIRSEVLAEWFDCYKNTISTKVKQRFTLWLPNIECKKYPSNSGIIKKRHGLIVKGKYTHTKTPIRVIGIKNSKVCEIIAD